MYIYIQYRFGYKYIYIYIYIYIYKIVETKTCNTDYIGIHSTFTSKDNKTLKKRKVETKVYATYSGKARIIFRTVIGVTHGRQR